MARNKLKSHKTELKPEHPTHAQVSPEIPYFQPLSSPYELPIVTVTIGSKKYGLPFFFLQKYPRFSQLEPFWCTTINLSDVHEDAGHTLVHFLYSGNYETTTSSLDQEESKIAQEYRKAVLAYHASRVYQLSALEVLAKGYIEDFGEEMSTPDTLRITREVLSKLPNDETWLLNHIKLSLEKWLLRDESNIDLDALYTVLGQDHSFDNVVTKMMLEILSSRLFYLGSTEDKTNLHGQLTNHVDENKDILSKDPLAAAQEYEGSRLNDSLATDYSTPVEAPAGAYSEDAATAAAESPEDAPADTYPEEAAAVAYPEPENTPADTYPEEVAAVEYPEPAEAPAEVYPDNVAAEVHYAQEELIAGPVSAPEKSTVKLVTTHLQANIYLYEDWNTLTPKKRRSRTKTLRARGLPVPDKDGLISSLMG